MAGYCERGKGVLGFRDLLFQGLHEERSGENIQQ